MTRTEEPLGTTTRSDSTPKVEPHSFLTFPEKAPSQDDPWEGDLFKRQETANILSELLLKGPTPLVFCVNSSWGSGKTYFLERWHKSLLRTGALSAYFNAWEAEVHHGVFGNFLEQIFRTILPPSGKEKDFVLLTEKSKLLGYCLSPFLPALLAGAGFLGAHSCGLDSPEAQKALEIVSQEVGKTLGNDARKKLADWAERETSKLSGKVATPGEIKQAIQRLMEECFSLLPEVPQKIFVFVDELDRCRPDYSIRFLEGIKHLFSVHGLVFILGLDLVNLSAAVKHLYGAEFDAQGYLRRFFHQRFNLPAPDIFSFCNALFTEFLPGNIHERIWFPDLLESPQKTFGHFAASFQSSLRDIQQVFSRLVAILNSNPNVRIFSFPTFYFLFAQHHKPDEWEGLLRNPHFRSFYSSPRWHFSFPTLSPDDAGPLRQFLESAISSSLGKKEWVEAVQRYSPRNAAGRDKGLEGASFRAFHQAATHREKDLLAQRKMVEQFRGFF